MTTKRIPFLCITVNNGQSMCKCRHKNCNSGISADAKGAADINERLLYTIRHALLPHTKYLQAAHTKSHVCRCIAALPT